MLTFDAPYTPHFPPLMPQEEEEIRERRRTEEWEMRRTEEWERKDGEFLASHTLALHQIIKELQEENTKLKDELNDLNLRLVHLEARDHNKELKLVHLQKELEETRTLLIEKYVQGREEEEGKG